MVSCPGELDPIQLVRIHEFASMIGSVENRLISVIYPCQDSPLSGLGASTDITLRNRPPSEETFCLS